MAYDEEEKKDDAEGASPEALEELADEDEDEVVEPVVPAEEDDKWE